ncbi:MAG: TetR/AcrR family transcriptional regulator [Proteobacteria bacterium]|nr:TetR/AcrR family transcriptional regulator [Pseudomonadota bacterium]
MATETRETAKQRTRRALLQAGSELFAEQGLDGPSLDAICERAGYTRGAFYVHFSGRDDFLVAVMEHAGKPLLDMLLDSAGEEALTTIAARFARAVSDGTYPLTPPGRVRPHQLLDACARSERVRALYVQLLEEAVERLERAIASDQTSGVLRADVEPQPLATVLLAAVIGAQIMMEFGAEVDLARCTAAVVDLLQSPGVASTDDGSASARAPRGAGNRRARRRKKS